MESESEWAQNKTLITLKDQDLSKMVFSKALYKLLCRKFNS